jgi:hypothetical protein
MLASSRWGPISEVSTIYRHEGGMSCARTTTLFLGLIAALVTACPGSKAKADVIAFISGNELYLMLHLDAESSSSLTHGEETCLFQLMPTTPRAIY